MVLMASLLGAQGYGDSITAGSSVLVQSDRPGPVPGVPHKPQGDLKSEVLGPSGDLLTKTLAPCEIAYG